MYEVRFLDEAINNLAKIDKGFARRIIRKINWLNENIENIQPKGLSANLAGLSMLREGDYRIIYQIIHEEKLIIIHFIGHRSQVYKNL